MIDNFATVDEAVAEVEKNAFDVVSDMMPDGTRIATLHLSTSATASSTVAKLSSIYCTQAAMDKEGFPPFH